MHHLTANNLESTRVSLNEEDHWYRLQGIRYDVQIVGHPKITVTFHEIYSQVLRLANDNKKDQMPLIAIHEFIRIKLQIVEREGREDYEKKTPFYKWLTEICRLFSKIFGITPKEGTHQERLEALEKKIATIATNLISCHDPEFYGVLKKNIENGSQSGRVEINPSELPECDEQFQFKAIERIERDYKCVCIGYSPTLVFYLQNHPEVIKGNVG